jgi:integrase
MQSDARPPLRSARLIDQLRERIRYCHYSLKTEKAYVHWARRYIRLHRLRHPREMGSVEVESFLNDLVNKRRCAASTHKQALAAILFLYREILDIDLPWMQELKRPRGPTRIPAILSRAEVARLLACVDPEYSTIVSLLYGAGLRLMEGLRLRTKDLDFDRKIIVIREAKGKKDRVVMLLSRWRRHFGRRLRTRTLFGHWIARTMFRMWRCPTRRRASIRVPARVGHGSGLFPRRRWQPICELKCCADIINTNGTSDKPRGTAGEDT